MCLMVPGQKRGPGRPRSLHPPPKCEFCSKRSKPCGPPCPRWPRAGCAAFTATPAGPSASHSSAAPLGAVLTLPRVRKQRDLDMELPEAPRLCNRATGSRWRPAAGSELEGEAAEPSAEGGQEEGAALALVQLSSSERRRTEGRAGRAAWVRSPLMLPLMLPQDDSDCMCLIP